MSKRKRRNSRRRRSSYSSKQSISPHSLQKHIKSPLNNVLLEDDSAEKGETDSFCKENVASDEEENEAESPNNENTFREGSYGNLFEENEKKAKVTKQANADKGLTITHSVTIDDFGISTPKIVFQQSHSSAAGETVSSVIAVTTAKVKNLSSNMRLEINEVVQSDDSGIKTTVTLRHRKDKVTETCIQSQKLRMPSEESFGNPYSWNQHETYVQNDKYCENVSYQVSIAELKTEVKDSSRNSSSLNSQEEMNCFKSCCKDHLCSYDGSHSETDFTLVDASSTSSMSSEPWLSQRQLSLPSSLSNEPLWYIPPPQEFADKERDIFQDLTENVASCQIHDSNVFKERGDCQQNTGALGGSSWFKQSKCQFSLDEDKRAYKPACYNQHDLDSQENFFRRPLAPVSRSSFTKRFIQNHKGKMRMRNNSIAILQTNAQACANMDIPKKRRRTFPGVVYRSHQARESIPSCRESFSSGTLSSFFMQSLPSQADRAARFFLEDERLGLFEGESRKSSSSSSSYRPSSSSFGCPEIIIPHIKAYTTTKNPFYPSRSDDTSEEVFLKRDLEREESGEAEEMMHGDRADLESFYTGPLEPSEVTESGFDEEMAEVEEYSPVVLVEDTHLKNLLIHVTPPSPCNSEEHISEGTSNKNNPQSYEGHPVTSKNRRSSVVTFIVGGNEQRALHTNESPSEDVLQRHQSESSTETSSELVETLATREEPTEVLSQNIEDFCTSVMSTSSHSVLSLDNSVSSEHTEDSPTKAMKSTRKASLEAGVGSNRVLTNRCLEKTSTDFRRTVRQLQTETERQTTSKYSVEVKEHLKPPGEHKDSEEASDHWAKKRKLFKESKQWSSAGGSSLTSQITEESDTMNSEDTRSVDTSLRDIEDRGFYTETFHSTSWIYRGDEGNTKENVQCFSKCPRTVAVRERTVKISKGMGEYPWGFRIQYSKPIVVTEVDTNGAAEEAGLQVGDYVLAVNGTDVTSVPHSEAADLARQGPDLLTLTIGSDIGRTPNTPRPACRGYLHKRTQSSLLKGWRKRWFVLRHDCCLYYYRNKRDEGKSRALSSIRLEGAVVEADSSLGKPFVFRCSPASRTRDYYLCATSNQEMRRWLEAMERAVHPITQNHVWVDVTRHNASLPPLAVKNPECLGLLHLLDRIKDSWVQHYCILKDACLYFYASMRSTYAVGGIYLHGYMVREQPLGSKRSTIELRPPSEEFKVFNLCAENPTENKRWIGSIKTSIEKWMPLHQAIQDYMSLPPEETKM